MNNEIKKIVQSIYKIEYTECDWAFMKDILERVQNLDQELFKEKLTIKSCSRMMMRHIDENLKNCCCRQKCRKRLNCGKNYGNPFCCAFITDELESFFRQGFENIEYAIQNKKKEWE